MAQTTTAINGTNVKLYLDTVLVANLTSVTSSFDADVLDTSSYSTGKYRENIMGRMGGNVSFEGFMYFNADETFQQMFEDMKAGTQVALKISNGNAGDYELGGNANITSIELNSSDNEVVTFSGEFLINGEPTYTVIT